MQVLLKVLMSLDKWVKSVEQRCIKRFACPSKESPITDDRALGGKNPVTTRASALGIKLTLHLCI